MKKLLLILMIINSSLVFSQQVAEVKKIEFSKEFNETRERANQLRDSTIDKKIENLEAGLKMVKNSYERYRIVFNSLGYFYVLTNQYDKAIDLWSAANKEGIFLPFQISKDNVWPSYLSNFSDNKRFETFLKTNDSLRLCAVPTSKAEYFVNLPENYNPQKRYPLIILMHGGCGENFYNYEKWNTEIIRKNFISVFPHGSFPEGSFAYSYGQSGVNDMKEIYHQVIENYPIDSSMVILGGQSYGGELAIRLACDRIPVHGLFLAFPTIPVDFDRTKALVLKKWNAKIVMLCGDKDFSFQRAHQMSVTLDSAGVENDFRKYPDLGHDFPADFLEQLGKGMIYLTEKR